MRNAGRNIVMLLDNFSGHFIEYEPRNIRLEYFEPNLTSFVQPCDAGIIRCVKAHYRRAYCLRAIELDEANEHDIYKIDLLEAMLMVKDAWHAVTAETIKHCWNHTGIQPPIVTTGSVTTTTTVKHLPNHRATKTEKGWDVIREFAASSSMTLPQVEERLKSIFGADYIDQDWRPALKAVLEAENDEVKALEAIEKLTMANNPIPTTNSTKPATLSPLPVPLQLQDVEQDLVAAIDELKVRKRIIGTPLTLEEMLNPIEDQEIGDSMYRFEGGDDEIVATVQRELEMEAGDIMEVDESDDEAEEKELTTKQVMELCQQMETLCIKHGSFGDSLGLAKHLRQYRIHLNQEQAQKAKQTTLDNFF